MMFIPFSRIWWLIPLFHISCSFNITQVQLFSSHCYLKLTERYKILLVYVISWPFGRRDSHVVVCFDGVTPITNQRISLKRPNKLWRKYNGKGLHELYTLHSFVCSITTYICNHVVIITILSVSLTQSKLHCLLGSGISG